MKWRNRDVGPLALADQKYRVVASCSDELTLARKRWPGRCGAGFIDFSATWAYAGQVARVELNRIRSLP